jgi:hypothetical protein
LRGRNNSSRPFPRFSTLKKFSLKDFQTPDALRFGILFNLPAKERCQLNFPQKIETIDYSASFKELKL